MFDTDKSLIRNGLLMWANKIETGDTYLSPVDMKNCGRESEVRALSDEQKALVLRIRKLADKHI